jgi:hypothetical protein
MSIIAVDAQQERFGIVYGFHLSKKNKNEERKDFRNQCPEQLPQLPPLHDPQEVEGLPGKALPLLSE